MMILEELLSSLVRIPSVNPFFAPPNSKTANEGELALQVACILDQLGVVYDLNEYEPCRPNLYAMIPGRSQRWIGWDIHTDTVGIDGMTIDPFGGSIRDGKIFGRGACDTKASLAIALHLLQEAKRAKNRPEHSLLLIASYGEETGGLGASRIGKWLNTNGIVLSQMVVAEPTSCRPVYAHNGLVRGALRVQGRSAHTSNSELGVNAALGAAAIALAFEREHLLLRKESKSLTGPATLTVTGIKGGGLTNSVPDSAYVFFDRRVVPGEWPVTVKDRLMSIATSEVSSFSDMTVELVDEATIYPLRAVPALMTDPESDLVRSFVNFSGQSATTVRFGTNAAYYGAFRPAETIVFGPGSIDQAHTPDEWVSIDQLYQATDIMRQWLNFT